MTDIITVVENSVVIRDDITYISTDYLMRWVEAKSLSVLDNYGYSVKKTSLQRYDLGYVDMLEDFKKFLKTMDSLID